MKYLVDDEKNMHCIRIAIIFTLQEYTPSPEKKIIFNVHQIRSDHAQNKIHLDFKEKLNYDYKHKR